MTVSAQPPERNANLCGAIPQRAGPSPHPSPRELVDAIGCLLEYCRRENWSGWDPFDGLNSRLFQATPLRHSALARLAWIQFFKRCPVNLRPLVGVPKSQNPKGIALFVSALVRLSRLGLASLDEARALADRLLELRSPGRRHFCWGYNFDWQTRAYLVPAGTPNIVCTSFAGEALLDAAEACRERRYLDAAAAAGRFILEDLPRTTADAGVCFSYTPLRPTRVHNASLLGAAFLGRLHRATDAPEFGDAALAAARYGLQHQRPDGSWIYGEDPHQGWVDSFHTGYNLLALRAIARHLGLAEAEAAVRRGFTFYREHFIRPDGVVAYFHDRVWPIDLHALAHAVITLTELRDLEADNAQRAERICDWAITDMRSPAGWFHYQRWSHWTNRSNYIRWCQAWMLLALATAADEADKI